MPLKEMQTWRMRKNRHYLQGRCGPQGRNALGLAEHGPALLLHSDRKELVPFLVSRDCQLHQLAAPQSDMVARGSECQVVKIEKQVKGSCLQFVPGGIRGGRSE